MTDLHPEADRDGDPEPTRLDLRSADVIEPRIDALAKLFPEAVKDGKLDVDSMRAALGDVAEQGPERFGLTWPGKGDAIRRAQRRAEGTLVPMKGESVEWETTKNVIIEGENLEVLKLLQRSYHSKVKLIYIDPPYNTGKDFVYPDNFREPLEEYLRYSGQVGENGGRLRANAETGGRFHSAWLSMMWPRLHLARSLLREDGVIVVSIDDNEEPRLRSVMDEIFGEENRIAQLVWDKTRKNDAKLFSVGHEYLVVYGRSLATLRERGTVWRRPHPGATTVWAQYENLRATHGDDDKAVEAELRAWFRSLPADDPAKGLSRYKQVDAHGPWRDRDISWPGGGGPRYEVIHPVTGQPCKIPQAGWRFSSPAEMSRQIDLGLVVFRSDHLEPPFRKAHLRSWSSESGADTDSDEGELGLQVMSSYIHAQAQVTVKALRRLFNGEHVFDNPKDPAVLRTLFSYIVGDEPSPIILDFFAGSGSTAEALIDSTVSSRYILVQLPEALESSTWETLSKLCRERVRRVLERASSNRQTLHKGFRAYRLDAAALREKSTIEEEKAHADRLFMDAVNPSLRRGSSHRDPSRPRVRPRRGGHVASGRGRLGRGHRRRRPARLLHPRDDP
jgi:adenine-specific DNA-methyltransferase